MKNRILLFTFFIFAVVAVALIGSLFKARSDQAKKLEVQSRELAQFSDEKDSIAMVLGETTRYISDVYSQVSNVAGAVAVTKTLENIDNLNYKNQVADKLAAISDVVTNYKQQMQQTEERIKTLKERNAGFAHKLTALEKTIGELKETIAKQEQRIAELSSELEITRAERDRYKAEALAKAKKLIEREQELVETQEELNTAYFIIGKLDELNKRGYIEKEGSVLIFGGAWKPSDSLAVDENFTKIDIRQTTEIEMKSKYYRIVSPHDVKLLRPRSNEAESVPYTLKISRPERFWSQSKILIIAED
jgi:septal ring factor EnvC (AmiA/AmiB activator)